MADTQSRIMLLRFKDILNNLASATQSVNRMLESGQVASASLALMEINECLQNNVSVLENLLK